MIPTIKHYESAKRLLTDYCFDEEYFLAEFIINAYENKKDVSEKTIQLLGCDIVIGGNGVLSFVDTSIND